MLNIFNAEWFAKDIEAWHSAWEAVDDYKNQLYNQLDRGEITEAELYDDTLNDLEKTVKEKAAYLQDEWDMVLGHDHSIIPPDEIFPYRFPVGHWAPLLVRIVHCQEARRDGLPLPSADYHAYENLLDEGMVMNSSGPAMGLVSYKVIKNHVTEVGILNIPDLRKFADIFAYSPRRPTH